jgi:Mitochondrial carrier protein
MSSDFSETLIDDNEDFDFEGDRGDSPFIVHMLAGSMAGLMEHVAIFPMDTIKVNK